jgi:hypothetical protein
MAGYTPPKPPERRARRNKDQIAAKLFEVDPQPGYPLPWWRRWCDSPLAAELPAVDWSELEACAVLHHQFMKKRSFTLASELRLRMGAFGATPVDRARLRYQVAVADEKETNAPASSVTRSARDRRGTLHALRVSGE